MGVVYIGDRATGKTALALELINPKFESVHIPNQSYQDLKNSLVDVKTGEFIPTKIEPDSVYHTKKLRVEVALPAGSRQIIVDWLDTPGEMWQKSWKDDHPQQWQKVLATVQKSEGILLVLPPYREMPGLKSHPQLEDFPTLQQWCKRFYRWVDFFIDDCSQARHIVLCLNKADLFCDLRREAYELAYQPTGSRRNWYQRNTYTMQRYFLPIQREIKEISQKNSGMPVRCFITSIYNRSLLELPWIYLASYLSS